MNEEKEMSEKDAVSITDASIHVSMSTFAVSCAPCGSESEHSCLEKLPLGSLVLKDVSHVTTTISASYRLHMDEN